MQKHPYSYDDLIDFLLGKLEPEKSVQLGQHLGVCPSCSGTVARYSKIRALARQEFGVGPSKRAIARAKAIPREYRPEHRFPWLQLNPPSRRFAYALSGAVSLVLVFVFAMFIANQEIEPDSALYPVKIAVEGLQVTATSVGQFFGVKPRSTTGFTLAIESSSSSRGASSPSIVISQVYGGGGNNSATLTHDFIELFNSGNLTVSLSGWSLQYASSLGNTNFGASPLYMTELGEVSLAPGQYLLIQEARGRLGTVPLPTPDVIDPTPIEISATSGKVALVNTITPLGCNGNTHPCSPASLATIVDFVSYGNADFFAGTGPAPEANNTSALLRANDGCVNTKNNANDFRSSLPNPRNRAHPIFLCTPVPTKP